MYIAYIRSDFDYASLVWYLFLSLTQIKKLETCEHEALFKILEVPLSIRISDLHLEVNVCPLVAWWKTSTVYQAEKYCQHPVNNPLRKAAFITFQNRSKRRSWQSASINILHKVNIQPSLSHCNNMRNNNIALHDRKDLNFTSQSVP